MRKLTILSIFIIAFVPLGLYFLSFQFRLSNNSADWAAFGSYIGGVYGTLAFFALAWPVHITRNQFIMQHEDETFYKAMESLKAGTVIKSNKLTDNTATTSFPKNFVLALKMEFENQSPYIARQILCMQPSIISDTNITKIICAINSSSHTTKKFEKKIL